MSRIGLAALTASVLLLAASSASGAEPRLDAFDAIHRNAWYLPTQDKAARLFVTEMGTGPKVVVLHGGPGGDFQYLVDAVRPHADRNTFVLFDQRGSVLSPVRKGREPDLTFEKAVEDIETLRQALGEEKLVLLGHSFGTVFALAYYERHPDRVAGLILTASAPPRTPPGGNFSDLIQAARPAMQALAARPEVAQAIQAAGLPAEGAPETPQQASLRNKIAWSAAYNLARPERWRDLKGGGVLHSSAAEEAIGATLPETYDVGRALRDHAVPVTVIQGDQDYLDPAGRSWRELASEDLGGAAGSVAIEVLPQAGHYAWIDQPQRFRDALRRALARPRAR